MAKVMKVIDKALHQVHSNAFKGVRAMSKKMNC